MSKCKRIMSFLLALLLTIGTIGYAGIGEVYADESITVTMNFDCSSLGTEEALSVIGFNSSMDSITVTIPKGGTVYDAIQKAAEEKPTIIEVNEYSKYIKSAYGLGDGLSGISDILGYLDVPSSPYNYNWAGWNYSVDGKSAIVGAAEYKLESDSKVDFRYMLAYKDGGAYDWDFADGYDDAVKAIAAAKVIDRSKYTEEQLSYIDSFLVEVESAVKKADDESAGIWVLYYQDLGTTLYGPGSITDKLQTSAKNLNKAVAGNYYEITGINATCSNIYLGKKAKINVEVLPSNVPQDVSYEIILGDGAEVTEDGYLIASKKELIMLQVKSKEDPTKSTMLTIKSSDIKDVPEITKDLKTVYEETQQYIEGTISPGYDDWKIIGLARSGALTDAQKEDYYNSKVEYLNSLKNDRPYATDYARTIIGLTAAGWDPRNIEGENLLYYLTDMEFIEKQGVNAAAYTLIAFDTHDYEIPENSNAANQVTREGLIKYILELQKTDGGWNWDTSASDADVDMTAMVLQSLAPYYNNNKEVKDACDKAIEILSQKQSDDGTYVSWGVQSVSSMAEVIVALTAFDIDPGNDSRFVKNGKSLIDGLLSLAVDGGGFKYDNDEVNDYSTKSGFYSMVAYDRFIKNISEETNSLYDMNDVDLKIHINGENSDKNPGEQTNDQNMDAEKIDSLAKTGDYFNPYIFLVVAIMALAAATVVVYIGRKERRE